MSWELAALIVLAGALALGFGWYERAHPSSRMLALVATLAALAAIARIAFAPLPNVKPTTDIIVIAGFALGGAPGFVVGAVAALASNLFFGQGPWTPWQMVAWGICGLLGAALGRASGHRAGRWQLAAVCGAAGLVFGVIMDASVWVTYGGQQTAGQYLAIAGTSLPFNLAHIAGNVVFALAFGPVLVRALLRYRARLEVRWEDAPVPARGAVPAGPLAALLAAAAVAGALAAPGEAAADARTAATYLARTQNADGGWGMGPRARSAQLPTAWAVIGLGAARYDPLRVRSRGRHAGGILRSAAINARATGDLERAALGAAAAGLNPRTWRLDRRLRAAQDRGGSFDGLVNLTSYGILALRAARVSGRDAAVRRAAAWLVRQQNRDGGFSFSRRGGVSGIDDTAGAVQALAAAGQRRGRAARRAAAFLARRQNADGGYPLQPGGRSNAQSTALAVQALLAAGRDPGRQRRRGARPPLAFLRSLQQRDGSVRYSRTSAQTPVWVTAQALAAFARRPLPVVLRR